MAVSDGVSEEAPLRVISIDDGLPQSKKPGGGGEGPVADASSAGEEGERHLDGTSPRVHGDPGRESGRRRGGAQAASVGRVAAFDEEWLSGGCSEGNSSEASDDEDGGGSPAAWAPHVVRPHGPFRPGGTQTPPTESWAAGHRDQRAGRQGGGGGRIAGGASGSIPDDRTVRVAAAAPGEHNGVGGRSGTGMEGERASSTHAPRSVARLLLKRPAATAQHRKVGHATLKMHQHATAKVATLFNRLYTECVCRECERFKAPAYLSVGAFPAPKAVIDQSQRQRWLEDTAAGVGKATGTRDPALPEQMQMRMVQQQLRGPQIATEFNQGLILAALFVIPFSLGARKATARGLEWSDVVILQFSSMWHAAKSALTDVLCWYVYATKTTEKAVLCLGSIAHVSK